MEQQWSNQSFDEVIPNIGTLADSFHTNETSANAAGPDPDLPRSPVPAVPQDFYTLGDILGMEKMQSLTQEAAGYEQPRPIPRGVLAERRKYAGD